MHDSQTHNAWHWTDKTDGSLLLTYTQSPKRRVPHAMRGHMEGINGPTGTVGGRLCSNKRMGQQLVTWEDVHAWLFEHSMAGREKKPVRLRSGCSVSCLLDEGNEWGTFPPEWRPYLGRAGQLMVRSLGSYKAQRCQGSSTWNVSSYDRERQPHFELAVDENIGIFSHICFGAELYPHPSLCPSCLVMCSGSDPCSCPPIAGIQ